MNPHRRYAACLLLFLAAGCTVGQRIAESAPAAKTPVLTRLQAAPSATGALADVPWINGEHGVLRIAAPTGLPRNVVKLFFSTHTLSTLKVTLDGMEIFERTVPSPTAPDLLGYYTLDNVDNNDHWQITVHVPSPAVPVYFHRIAVSTMSVNPNNATNGVQPESPPMNVRLGTREFVVGLAQPGLTACTVVPDFPLLQPGMTVDLRDLRRTMISFGWCCFGNDNLSADGKANTIAGPGYPHPGFREQSLYVKVGTWELQGGSGADIQFTVRQTTGFLELCVNDDTLSDNRGAWAIGLKIR